MPYNRWEIWRAAVRFEDSFESKERPILILNDFKTYVTAFKITSKNKLGAVRTYTIREWKKSGLDKESYVIIPTVITVDKKNIITKYGELHILDITCLRKELLQGSYRR